MTRFDFAESSVFDLYNVADHVSQCAQNAQVALKAGELDRALECLTHADRSAKFVEMHLQDARKNIERAAKEAVTR